MELINPISNQINQFRQYLIDEERTPATIEKYMRDIQAFLQYLSSEAAVSREAVIGYKKTLVEKYKSTSANSMLVALNRYFAFCGRSDLQVKLFKVQRTSFREQNKELSIEEYKRLVRVAKTRDNERLSLLIQTLCSTGIRVSEHRYITVEALSMGSARIINKGKERIIFLSKDLQKRLKRYCMEKGIISGPVFITKSGRPMNRCNIWTEMKSLCSEARVDSQKVFPHNLRHLFALTFYRLEKDIVRLADILGHTNIETTRIYTFTTAEECIRSLSRLNLLI